MEITTAEVKTKSSLGRRLYSSIRRNMQTYTLIIAVVVIWAIFAFLTNGSYLRAQNISNLFRQMTVTAFLSLGMVLVIVTGGIDLSVGKLAGFVSVVCAYLQYYVWYQSFPESTLSGGCSFDYLRSAGRHAFRCVAGLFHRFSGAACLHRDPGRHVAVQRADPLADGRQDHRGASRRIFLYRPGVYPAYVGMDNFRRNCGIPYMECVQQPARQAKYGFTPRPLYLDLINAAIPAVLIAGLSSQRQFLPGYPVPGAAAWRSWR